LFEQSAVPDRMFSLLTGGGESLPSVGTFRRPALNHITTYAVNKKDDLTETEKGLLARASKETVDNCTTGFLLGAVMPFLLTTVVKNKPGVSVLRACGSLFGSMFGSYVAAQRTTDRYILEFLTVGTGSPIATSLREKLFEFEPRGKLQKYVNESLKQQGLCEQVYAPKDVYEVRTVEEETAGPSPAPQVPSELNLSNRELPANIVQQNNESIDWAVAERRKKFSKFRKEEMKRLFGSAGPEERTEEESEALHLAIVNRIAEDKKNVRDRRKEFHPMPPSDFVDYDDQNEEGDPDGDGSFFSFFTDDSCNEAPSKGDIATSSSNDGRERQISPGTRVHDWESYDGDDSWHSRRQNIIAAKKTTWEELRAKARAAT